MSLVALMSMIPLYLREFHGLSSAMTGFAFGMMVLFGAFMQPVMGRLSDRAGRRRVIVFGIAIAAVCAFMIPILENLGLLLMIIILLLVGVGLLRESAHRFWPLPWSTPEAGRARPSGLPSP